MSRASELRNLSVAEVARKLDPENEAALNNLATLYLAKGQYDKAVALLREITARHPEDVAAEMMASQGTSLVMVTESLETPSSAAKSSQAPQISLACFSAISENFSGVVGSISAPSPYNAMG